MRHFLLLPLLLLLKVHDLKQSFLIKHSAISSFLNIHSDAHVSVCHKLFNAFSCQEKYTKDSSELIPTLIPLNFLSRAFLLFFIKISSFFPMKKVQFFFGVFLIFSIYLQSFFLTDLFHCSTSTVEELKHKIAQSLKKVKKSFYLKKCVVMKKKIAWYGGKEII